MTRIQKEFQSKLQIERQLLSMQLKGGDGQEMISSTNPVEAQVHSKLQVKLSSIERALHRLEKGTYGVCQSCGEEIDSARLEALPYAEQCIDCQRRLERRVIHGYAYAYPSS
jgi:DnaK suppressor protein